MIHIPLREGAVPRNRIGRTAAALGAAVLALLSLDPPAPAQSTWNNPAGGRTRAIRPR